MRILFLGNNWVGWKIASWLREQGEEFAGLVVHPPNNARYRDEIVACTGVESACVFDGSRLRDPTTLAAIKATRPELGVSALFAYIVDRAFLDLLPRGCLNVHSSLLPFGRGRFTNVWSIVDRTPAGATIHYIDEGVDTGDIVAQQEVLVEPVDTGASLYRKLEEACLALFQETWPLIRAETARRDPQPGHLGTSHRKRDVEQIDEIHLEQTYKARDLIDVIRARTFPPYTGAYFVSGGRKVYLRLELLYEEERNNKDGDGVRG